MGQDRLRILRFAKPVIDQSRLPRVRAEKLSSEQAGRTMVAYGQAHPRAARGLARFMGYEVDGTDAAYRAMGETLPMLRLVPRESAPP